MGRLIHWVQVVDIAHRFKVWKDAGADHESEEVHCYKDGSAGAEGNQQARGICMVWLQLHLHHSHLDKN